MNYGGGTAAVGRQRVARQSGRRRQQRQWHGHRQRADPRRRRGRRAVFNALGNYFSSGVGLSFNDSVLTVSNCLIAGNEAQADDGNALGGGVYNGATATLKNSFIAFNEAEATEGSALGGGIYTARPAP